MSTLCTQTTNSPTTDPTLCNIRVEDSAHTRRRGQNTTATLAQIWKRFTQFFVTRYNQRIDRQAFNNVLTLDDRALRDIGVTRQDVKWASRLPLSEDAALRLESIARRR